MIKCKNCNCVNDVKKEEIITKKVDKWGAYVDFINCHVCGHKIEVGCVSIEEYESKEV